VQNKKLESIEARQMAQPSINIVSMLISNFKNKPVEYPRRGVIAAQQGDAAGLA
jgi:hypothetical protein